MAPSTDADFEPAPLPQIALRLTGVCARYGGGAAAADVLAEIDFAATYADVTTVTGGAAAGKSALLDILALRLVPHDGEFEVLGVNARKLSAGARARLKRKIGLVRQTPRLLDHLTAFENVAVPLRLLGRKPRDYADDVAELLGFVGLNEDRGAQPAILLSGSERRRVAIARAVVAQPALLLADEPTAGLAPDLAGKVLRLLLGMRRAGAAIVIATQDPALAEALGGEMWRFAGARLERLERSAPPPAPAAAGDSWRGTERTW
jgi:cell division transport system ATP-binding protein